MGVTPPDEAAWLQQCAQAVALQDWPLAASRFKAAIEALPASWRLHFNQGVLLRQLGRSAEAVACWQRVLALHPDHASAHAALAQAVLAKDPLQALRHARCAAALAPDSDAHQRLLGRAELSAGNPETASAVFEALLKALPGDEDAQTGLQIGRLLVNRGEGSMPVAQLSSILAMLGITPEPGDEGLDGRLLYVGHALQRTQACDWRERDALIALLQRLVQEAQGGRPASLGGGLAWHAQHLGLGPAAAQTTARVACERRRRLNQPKHLVSLQARGPVGRRMRVAYVSYNFRDHPTTLLVHRLLAEHDRAVLELHAYALNADDASERRRQIAASADHFEDLSALSPADMAARLAAQDIDIFIGLGGHQEGPLIEVMQYRPAPVMVNFLAYHGTIGSVGDVDYHLSDAVSTPASLQPWFDEAIVHLSPSVLCYDDQAVMGQTPTRSEVGLPEDATVFCGFNNAYKIEPASFGAWCQILHAVPDSVLWLYIVQAEQVERLRAEALARGIAPERLIFAERTNAPAHLARFALADVYLDTFLYNGHTTMLDALYAGVPAVTLPGEEPVSRIGASILVALDMQEWIARDADDFVARAVQLAADAPARAQLRQQLREARGTRLPFHPALRARELEQAWRVMFDRAVQGLPPAPFAVTAE
jgi:protein O-GlcNAc transferase